MTVVTGSCEPMRPFWFQYLTQMDRICQTFPTRIMKMNTLRQNELVCQTPLVWVTWTTTIHKGVWLYLLICLPEDLCPCCDSYFCISFVNCPCMSTSWLCTHGGRQLSCAVSAKLSRLSRNWDRMFLYVTSLCGKDGLHVTLQSLNIFVSANKCHVKLFYTLF